MKIDNAIPIQPNTSSTGELTQTLNVGDVFRARIISIATNSVLLKLSDGSQMNATTVFPLDLFVGDFAEFQVKDSNVNASGNRLVIETVKSKSTDVPKTSDLEKSLASIGKKADPETINIVKTLLDNNIKVTKQGVEDMSKLLKDFKLSDITPQKAVFLMQNNVPINKDSIQTLNAFLNKEFNLVNTFNNISSQISNLSESKLSEINNKLELLESFEKLSSMLSKLSNMAASSGKDLDMDLLVDKNIKNLLKNSEFISQLATLETDIPKAISTETFKSEKNSLPFFDFEKRPETALENRPERLKHQEEITKKIFDGCFVKLHENISPEELDVKEIYKKILLRISIIKDTLDDSKEPSSSDVLNNISDFDKQLNFSNSINSNHTYVQIPINYQGQKNGGLYIIKKKRSSEDNSNGTTVFLSLNTINIGRFETLVNVNDKKIKLNIRLEKDDLIDFVKNNYNIIYDLLSKTDNKIVDIKCKKIDEEISPINIESIIKNEFIGNPKSIDVKL